MHFDQILTTFIVDQVLVLNEQLQKCILHFSPRIIHIPAEADLRRALLQ